MNIRKALSIAFVTCFFAFLILFFPWSVLFVGAPLAEMFPALATSPSIGNAALMVFDIARVVCGICIVILLVRYVKKRWRR